MQTLKMSVDPSSRGSTKAKIQSVGVLSAGGDRKRSSNWRTAARAVMMSNFVRQKALDIQKDVDEDTVLRDFAAEVFRR